MASTPKHGIVFVNNDLSGNVQERLINQLFIDVLLTGEEFDAKLDGYADGYYLENIRANSQRIMVVRSYLKNDMPNNIPNREHADLILFVKSGLANIVTKEGHRPSLPVVHLYWGAFGFH